MEREIKKIENKWKFLEQAEDVSAAEDVESLQLKRLRVQQMKRLRMQQQGFGVDQH